LVGEALVLVNQRLVQLAELTVLLNQLQQLTL
jgi:hypothetical protein